MMRISNDIDREAPAARLRSVTVIALVALLALVASTTAAHADVDEVELGTADSFAVLAGQSVTNTGPTTITGDIGIHPGATDPPDNVTGSGSITLTGSLHDADAVAQQAKDDLVTAYDDAAGRTPDDDPGTELGGQTLVGGVYNSATLGITGTLTLDAEDDPDTVWVFQVGSTLITASDSRVELVNGADACNVFWQVSSSATLGTNSEMVGTIMALTSITLTTGATIDGRVLARNGSVTMDSNTITNEDCTDVADTTTVIELDNGDDNGTPVEPENGEDDVATGQVQEVPSGSVAAGSGPVDTAPRWMSLLFVGLLSLVAVGGTLGIAVRRRVRV